MENEGEGARCQDSSVSDSEHIEGTNAKHGAEQAVNVKVCNKSFIHTIRFFYM